MGAGQNGGESKPHPPNHRRLEFPGSGDSSCPGHRRYRPGASPPDVVRGSHERSQHAQRGAARRWPSSNSSRMLSRREYATFKAWSGAASLENVARASRQSITRINPSPHAVTDRRVDCDRLGRRWPAPLQGPERAAFGPAARTRYRANETRLTARLTACKAWAGMGSQELMNAAVLIYARDPQRGQ